MAPPTITFPTTPIPIPPVRVRIVLEGDLMGNMWLYSPPIVPPAGQNYVIWSEEFDNPLGWALAGGGPGVETTVTPNSVLSPIGDMTADTIIAGTANGYARQNVTVVGGQEYTFSVYMRADAPLTCALYMHGNVTSTPELNVVQNITAAWQRFSITATMGAADNSLLVAIGDYNTFISKTIYAWGAQLNDGPTATVYTKTTNVPIP